MRIEHRMQLPGATLCALAIAALPAAAQTPSYLVQDLGTLAGPDVGAQPGSQAFATGPAGAVVGLSVVDEAYPDLHGFYWRSGKMIDLRPLSGDSQSQAWAVNAAGRVVGTSFDLGDVSPRAVLWRAGAPGAGVGIGDFVPRDINDLNRVVGERRSAPGDRGMAVLWLGGLTDLGTLGGGHSSAYAIDDKDRVVGASLLADERTLHPFLWSGGVMHDLGTLGGAFGQAYDISNNGLVVGVAENASGQRRGFLYQVSSTGTVLARTDLGVLGGDSSYAYGVNPAGEVVGVSDSRAFLWNGTLVDLNTRIPASSGWDLRRAAAIDGSGRIVGWGLHHGRARAFRLLPSMQIEVGQGAGATVELEAHTGRAGAPAALLLVAIQGLPTKVPVARGVFDAQGRWRVTVPFGSAAPGTEFELAVLGALPSGEPAESAPVRVVAP